MKFLGLLLVISVFGLVSDVAAKHIKVYVLTGQSNSLGTTANKQDVDPQRPPADPADLKIAFFWSNRSTAAADGPAAIIGDSDGKITSLKAQQGQGKNPSFWGPEIAFARALYHSGERDFLVVKASRGGGGNGFWRQGKQMYQHVLTTVNGALGELNKQGHSYSIVGLLYLQGESDSVKESKVAGKNLGDLIDHLKKDLPEAKHMKTVVGGIGASGARRDATRAGQKKMAASRPDVFYFSNLDLQKNLYDRLHFDKAAKLEIGRRFFKGFKQFEP